MNRNLNILTVELDIVRADKAANIAAVAEAMRIMPQSTDIVVLPEMFSTGFIVDADSADALAEWNSGDTMRELHSLAQTYHTAIAGSFLARTASHIYNRAFFIEPDGGETFYDKRHLFRMGGETKVYSQGSATAPVIRFRGWNIKLIVCYDLRFPAWCRSTQESPFDLLLVVANWPKARHSAWSTLLAARAIENECYVCGVNRRGCDATDGIDYASDSTAIIDFKGKPVETSQHDCLRYASLSIDALAQFREKFPAWKDADSFTLHL
ncbi:MAG: nitrilase-related carbon-nitrogen hydrolase [Muribaculaceae bacterium]